MKRDSVGQGKACAGQMGTASCSAEKRQNLRHRIWEKGYQRLNSKRGASLAVALLGFLLCATVGSVVLAAASASMGRTERPDSDADLQRYSLESAAAFILEELQKPKALSTPGESTEGGKASSDEETRASQTFQFTQSWYEKTAKVSMISLKKDSDGKNSLRVDKDSDDYTEGPTVRVGGDPILLLDQKTEEGKRSLPYPATYSFGEHTVTLSDYAEYMDVVEKEDNNKFQYQTEFFQGAGNNLSSKNNTVNTNTTSISSLQDLRDVCAEQICRHFYYEMIQAGDAKSEEPVDSSWGESGTPAAQRWTQLVAGKTYCVTMRNVRIEVAGTGNETESGDQGTIYPVFADVTMDQNFNLTFHPYCGSREDGTLEKVSADNSMLNLYVSFPCDTAVTKTAYTSTSTSESTELLPSLTLVSTETITFTGPYDRADIPKNSENGDSKVTVSDPQVTEGDDPSATVTTYTVTTEEKLTRTRTVVTTERSVTLPVTWKQGVISTKEPEY